MVKLNIDLWKYEKIQHYFIESRVYYYAETI